MTVNQSRKSYCGGRTDFAGEESSRYNSQVVLTYLKLLQTKLPPTMRTHWFSREHTGLVSAPDPTNPSADRFQY